MLPSPRQTLLLLHACWGLLLVMRIATAASPAPVPPGDKKQVPATQTRRLGGHTDAVWSVAFSPNGQQAVSGSYDQTLRLWDVGTGHELQRFEGHTGAVLSVAFSTDGRFVVSGS